MLLSLIECYNKVQWYLSPVTEEIKSSTSDI